MTNKPKRSGHLSQPDDPAQSKRFIDMAREVEADERLEAVDEAFKKVVTPSAPHPHRNEKPASS